MPSSNDCRCWHVVVSFGFPINTGNVLGVTGVTSGLAVTLGMLQPESALMTQMLGTLLLGGSIGGFAASRIEVTSLPQMVALFHRYV